jgi:hypothetical protein
MTKEAMRNKRTDQELEFEAEARHRHRFACFNSGGQDLLTKTFCTKEDGKYYWCEVAEAEFLDWTAPAPAAAHMHGPFQTADQAVADQQEHLLSLYPSAAIVVPKRTGGRQ